MANPQLNIASAINPTPVNGAGFSAGLPNTQATGRPISIGNPLPNLAASLGPVGRGTTPAFSGGGSATPLVPNVSGLGQTRPQLNVAPGSAYTLNGVNYDAAGNPTNTVAGISTDPVSSQEAGINANAQRVAAAQASASAYASSLPNGGQAPAPNLSAASTTSNASSLGNGTSYSDLLASIAKNQNSFLDTAQQNQSELDSQNAYLQAVQNAQNFQQSLTQGELNQYGVGRPLSLDTGRAAQLGFNNQLQLQSFQNSADIAGKALGYQQQSRQIRTTAAQQALQTQLGLAGMAKPESISPGSSLINPSNGQVVAQGNGFQPPTYSDITQLATALFQNGAFPDYNSALNYATQNFQQIMGSQQSQSQISPTSHSTIPTVQGDNVFGYDLSSYATDPEHTDKILANLQSLPQGLTTPSAVQGYIQQESPNSPITGSMIYNASTTYGVPIPLLTALMQEESSLGTKGVATSTMNPGNVGNTDSGATVKYASWQDGVNATAKWLANHFTGSQTQQQAPALIQPAIGTLSDGTQFINQDKIPQAAITQAQIYSSQTGTPILTGDEVAKAHNLDLTTQSLDEINNLIPQILGSGIGGRLQGVIGNRLQAAMQSNPTLSSFQDYRTAALNSIQALAGGSGSGFRLSESEIKVATDNLPTITDNIETAQSKLAIMQSFINKWKNEILPNQKVPTNPSQLGDSQGGQSYQVGNQNYIQGPDGLYYAQ